MASGTVYVASEDGTVTAVDADSGDRVWASTADDALLARPAVADGTLFVGTERGTLYALDTASNP